MRDLNDVGSYIDKQDLSDLPEFLLKQLNLDLENRKPKTKIINMYKKGKKQKDITRAMKGICSRQYVSEVLKSIKINEK